MMKILLVEDNPGYIALTAEAFKESRLPNRLEVVEDGEEAMDFLHQRGSFENSERPDIILLDLNLPKKDGREVLNEIKAHPSLKKVPVVILTTSKEEEDVVKAYENYANCYIRKPEDLVGFMEIVRKTEDFWLNVVKLPPVE